MELLIDLWTEFLGFLNNAWAAIASIADHTGAILSDASIMSLVVALASLYVAWRAFLHDRQLNSLTALTIYAHSSPEYVPLERDGLVIGLSTTSYDVIEFWARGPGLRYEAQGVVWAPDNIVQAEVETDQQHVWGVNDGPIVIKVHRNHDYPGGWRDNYWKDVYVGVIWVQPGGYRRGFVTGGQRIKLPPPNSRQPFDKPQTWVGWRRRWTSDKTLKGVTNDPTQGSVASGRTLQRQVVDSHPVATNPFALTFGRKGRSPGDESTE